MELMIVEKEVAWNTSLSPDNIVWRIVETNEIYA